MLGVRFYPGGSKAPEKRLEGGRGAFAFEQKQLFCWRWDPGCLKGRLRVLLEERPRITDALSSLWSCSRLKLEKHHGKPLALDLDAWVSSWTPVRWLDLLIVFTYLGWRMLIPRYPPDLSWGLNAKCLLPSQASEPFSPILGLLGAPFKIVLLIK